MGKALLFTLAVLVAAVLFAMFGWSRMQSGVTERSHENMVVAPSGGGDEVAAGRSVEIAMPVDGDVAVAGREVAVTAPVDGYVMAAGADVAIDASVGDDLWAAGRRVTVTAPVGDSARLAGAEVRLEPEAEVRGDALVAGRSVEVRAPVRGNLTITGQRALLASEVDGTVEARTGMLELAPGAVIRGDLIARGPNAPDIASGARVDGEVSFDEIRPAGPSLRGWLSTWAFGFLALLVLGAVTAGPAPRWTARVAERVRDRFGASLLLGLGAMLLVVVLVPLFAFTLVGAPLAVMLLAAWTALVLISGVFVSLRLGAWALGRFFHRPAALPNARFAALTTGALLVSFLASLPWIGAIAWIVVPLVGVGALLLERVDAARHPAMA